MRRASVAFVFLIFFIVGPAWAKTIVVVGGGLAGLTTAYELQKAIKPVNGKVDLYVYEAKDRPGGRVFTVQLKGRPAEMGGENINDGGDALEMRRIAKELGLKIKVRPRELVESYYLDSATGLRHNVNDLIPYFPPLSREELIQTLTELGQSAHNLGDVIDGFFKKFPPPDLKSAEMRAVIRKAVEEGIRSYEGGDVAAMSARYATTTLVWTMGRFLKKPSRDPEPVDSIEGGNGRMVLALSRRLGRRLVLNRPLIRLDREGEKFRLEFKGAGKPVMADIVVLAIPAKPYAAIEFGPETLEPDRLKAIPKIGYGTHAKILIPGSASKKPPLASGEDTLVWRRGDESWHTVFLVGQAGILSSEADYVRSYERANAALPEGKRMKRSGAIQVPTRNFQSLNGPVTLSWALDPFIQGSYSHFRADNKELESTSMVEGFQVLSLFAPTGNGLYFAGEHTTVDPNIRGTMEAAVASGVLAAKMIAKKLGNGP